MCHYGVTETVPVPIDPLSPTPRYQQLAALLEAGIEDGTYPPESRLPSEKELTREHGVARETASKAMDVLDGKGLVVRVPGMGWFVKRG